MSIYCTAKLLFYQSPTRHSDYTVTGKVKKPFDLATNNFRASDEKIAYMLSYICLFPGSKRSKVATKNSFYVNQFDVSVLISCLINKFVLSNTSPCQPVNFNWRHTYYTTKLFPHLHVMTNYITTKKTPSQHCHYAISEKVCLLHGENVNASGFTVYCS